MAESAFAERTAVLAALLSRVALADLELPVNGASTVLLAIAMSTDVFAPPVGKRACLRRNVREREASRRCGPRRVAREQANCSEASE